MTLEVGWAFLDRRNQYRVKKTTTYFSTNEGLKLLEMLFNGVLNGHLSARFYIEIRLISGIGSRVVAAPNNNTTWHSFLLASEDTAPWCWGLQGGCHDRHRRPAGSRPHAKSQTSSIMQRVFPPEERHCAAASLHILQQPVLPPRPSDIQPQPTEAVFS